MAYTQLYEISNDSKKLLNKKFYSLLTSLNLSEYIDEINTEKKDFNKFKNKYINDLKNQG